MDVPKQITVNVDSREQYPVLFPKTIAYYADRSGQSKHLVQVKTHVRSLRTGDYSLTKWPKCCVIERKASLSELSKNLLTGDYARFTAAFDRLRDNAQYPYLLLDTNIRGLTTKPFGSQVDPERVLSAMIRETLGRGIGVLWVGNARSTQARLELGRALAVLMLTHALRSRDVGTQEVLR